MFVTKKNILDGRCRLMGQFKLLPSRKNKNKMHAFTHTCLLPINLSIVKFQNQFSAQILQQALLRKCYEGVNISFNQNDPGLVNKKTL